MSAPRPDGERCLSTIFAASRSSVTCNGGTSVDWPWFRSELTHTLETTYLLLHDNIRIIPLPGGIGGEHGEYSIAASRFPELIVDSSKLRFSGDIRVRR